MGSELKRFIECPVDENTSLDNLYKLIQEEEKSTNKFNLALISLLEQTIELGLFEFIKDEISFGEYFGKYELVKSLSSGAVQQHYSGDFNKYWVDQISTGEDSWRGDTYIKLPEYGLYLKMSYEC